MKRPVRILIVLVVLSLIAGCGGKSATATPEPTNTPRPTDTPEPTSTPLPTDTPVPTDTPEPTNTPTPTLTPTQTPTRTPKPTSTSTPTPTPVPEPLVYTGSGDAVVDLDRPNEASLIHIAGNAAGHHFAVKSYDSVGNYLELLVNTTEPYNGTRPLDFMADEYATRLEITASGDWAVTISPLVLISVLDVPGTYEGEGDDVIFLNGNPDLATIEGNQAGRHFAIKGYNGGRNLLVNTTDPYEGTVILHKETLILEIIAEGPWSITVTE
jgi:predicted small lipoprotein YifL